MDPLGNNTISQAQAICSGSTPSPLTGSQPTGAGGTGDFEDYEYLWEISYDGENFSNAPGVYYQQHYTPKGLFTANTWFRRVVTSWSCQQEKSISNEVLIQVTPLPQAPAIADAQVCYGTSVTLQVQNPDQALTYKWYNQQGSLLATGASFPVAAATSSATYYVEAVTRTATPCPSTARTPVTLTVTPALVGGDLIAAPAATLCQGASPGTLDGEAPTGGNGPGSYSYQWQQKTEAQDAFENITGATAPAYEPGPLLVSTSFRRIVRSGECSLVSNSVLVEVQPPLTNYGIRSSDTSPVCHNTLPGLIEGDAPEGGAGEGSYTYLWEWAKADGPGDFVDAPGVNNQKDYTPTVPLTESYIFRRTVSSGACAAVQSTVRVEVYAPLVNRIANPLTQICQGELPGTFSSAVPVTGGDPEANTIRWERSHNGGPFQAVAATESYQPAEGLAAGTWQYRRIITPGNCQGGSSNTITIEVTPPIEGNEIAPAGPLCAGSATELRARGPLSGGNGVFEDFQWQQRLEGASAFQDIAGATGDTYTATPAASTWYRRIVRSAGCTSTSEPVLLQVEQPIVNQISGEQSLCQGQALEKLASAALSGGNGDYTYQWERSESGLPGSFEEIPGDNARQQDYLPQNVSTSPSWFRRRVTGGACGPVYSNSVRVFYYPPVENQVEGDQQVCLGSLASPIGSPASQGYSYQWQRKTETQTQYQDIQGATTASFHPGLLQQSTS
ncbi:hypothetical protein ACFSKU_21940, partial [Pontibacter silvestris]